MENYKVKTKSDLEAFVCENWDKMIAYIDNWQKDLPIPIYSSVDVRESTHKFAPVDHNMYPAGFNNICSVDLKFCSTLFRNAFDRVSPTAQQIGLIPESHTKNKYYLENVFKLKDTIQNANTEVLLISPDTSLFPNNEETITLETQGGHFLTIYRVIQENDKLLLVSDKNHSFDIIVLNHDQSRPLAIEWEKLKTPVFPSPFVGWYKRQKIHHFKHYETVANKFAEHFSINPNLIQARFKYCENIDFNSKDGMEELANEVDALMKTLPEGSSAFVKASQGTYGMGISVVTSGEDIRQMNRKGRNKMDVGKNNLKFTSVLIQEGIETVLKYEDAPAEYTIYLVDGKSAGGFVRYNPEKGTQANLNSQGMLYQKLCVSDIKQHQDHKCKEAIYSIIARLSTVAAAYEIIENTKG